MPRAAVERLASLIPHDFTLGVATSAFQIEGALDEDGRGSSSWDEFAARPGVIDSDGSPALACDHYHRSGEDLDLVAGLGVDAYRFSIAWSRVQPEGRGAWNEKGWDFYDRLIDGMLARGLSPMATLFHWDTPLALEHDGGWLARATALRFAEYAAEAGRRFGDRVDRWVTLNEPVSLTLNGYALGIHAPGRQLLFDALPAAHHQLLGHGLAVQALRAARVRGQIGITNMHAPVHPASRGPLDWIHAKSADVLLNRLYADPVLLGRYPRIPSLGRRLNPTDRRTRADDLATIHAPLDFYGLNYYYPARIRTGPGPTPNGVQHTAAIGKTPFHLAELPEYAVTGFGWPISPEYCGVVLGELKQRYGASLPPVYITESGASFPEPSQSDGMMHDDARVAYLASHLEAALAAVGPGGPAEGVDLRGWYVWTLTDNFEWAAGYTQRFGLVHTDFATLERTPKASYYWLQQLARARHRPAVSA
ncbi:GH1 family beta-glucosidase [Sinomonas sp. ASV486]|uniref:Beta-glucosidase n=1 Tax=Sinomonas puerhi TaxID=3238584 RepID=A0AB39L0M8_9MICC|nr:GH1 family beta-glucosidase [Sinomonas sp. ASV486]MDQ4488754.1 GH1 family beta-glucosidase [Sinomonas sp. ASV486]